MQRLAHAFDTGLTDRSHRRLVEIARLLLGLLVIHRFADALGFAILAPNPGVFAAIMVLGVAMGLLVAIGLLTPIALTGLVVMFFAAPKFAPTLGDQIATVLCWALLLFGAGRVWSVDAVLRRKPRIGAMIRGLEILAVPDGRFRIPLVNAFALILFWAIAYTAASYHFFDKLWLRLGMLQALLTMPYMSEHAEVFAWFADQASPVFDALCRLGLGIQVVWELLLFPLMFWHWGRIFVKWQGLGFFGLSAICLNLGYLPLYEMVLWLLILAFLGPRRDHGQDEAVPTASMLRSLPAYFTLASGFLVAATYVFIVTVYQVSRGTHIKPLPFAGVINSQPFLYWGQRPIEVFNRTDMSMGFTSLVVAELDGSGRPTRVVPFQDFRGGRLDYLRNDLLYFDFSLPWQRDPLVRRVSDKGELLAPTQDLATAVATLDACLTDGGPDRFYRAYLFQRDLREGGDFLRWQPPRLLGAVNVTPSAERRAFRACQFAYSLPPGHFYGQRRRTESLEALLGN